MTEKLLKEIHSVKNLNKSIVASVAVEKDKKLVTVKLVTDKAFTAQDRVEVEKIIRAYVPQYFELKTQISKLSPDCGMVKNKIIDIINNNFKALSVTITESDVNVKKIQGGFEYEISAMKLFTSKDICGEVTKYLKKCYCGEFTGICVENKKNADDIEIEEEHENIDFEIPVRYFDISDFSPFEGGEKQSRAVYICDLNFESKNVTVCGIIDDVRERTYTNSKNQEKVFFSFTINDTTGRMRVTRFPRQNDIDKLRKLKAGDNIVCSGKSELYNGFLSFTANFIDYGAIPKNFIPEKRVSKPVPKYYSQIKPQPFTDITQTDMFTDVSLPACLKGKTFVVFDLETTGLNSSHSSGNIDRIIEIGAYKIIDGVISESFTTFINPQKKLSEEIINLTGITEEMIASAPTYEQVMPDFFKFCDGSVLVGHNIAGFDFRFVDYYCAKLGYMLERKIIDTIPLSQELLFLSNYKLNTVADKFGITFNHHRAIDDAYVTAKIFIELIKIKKSLPKLQ